MKTREKIVNEIINETARSVPQITNYRTGGVFRLFIEVVASFIEKFYQELERSSPNRFLQTATGKYLDLKAEELSLTRYPATKTRGYIIFSRGTSTQGNSSSPLTIAKNKILATKPNSQGKVLRFKVVAEVIISKEENARSVLVEAEDVGSQYNIVGGLITELITPIQDVGSITNANNWVVEIGKDTETDESLRSRCLALWRGLSGANKNAYISWAKSVEGIGDVRVVSTARGLGTVDVICVGMDNIQPNEELLKKVQSVIEERKPISTNVEIKAPSEVSIAMNLTVTLFPNSELNRQVIEEAVRKYFALLGIGIDFEPSALSSKVFEVNGVKSVVINTPKSMRITELQIARIGTITLELFSAREN